MKKLLFLSFCCLLAACGKDADVGVDKGKLDPNAKIVIKAGKSTSLSQMSVIRTGYTGLQVVQEAVNIKWTSHYGDNRYYETPKIIARTFGDYLKDFEKPALLMWGTDIISQEGDFIKDFIYGYNVVITDNHNDTIAFVPDSVINNARPHIEAAYNNKDYTTVYQLFNAAFTFYPYPAK